MKCIIMSCENDTSEGRFVGPLCAPCYNYLKTGKGIHSQAYRNRELATQIMRQLSAEKYRILTGG